MLLANAPDLLTKWTVSVTFFLNLKEFGRPGEYSEVKIRVEGRYFAFENESKPDFSPVSMTISGLYL